MHLPLRLFVDIFLLGIGAALSYTIGVKNGEIVQPLIAIITVACLRLWEQRRQRQADEKDERREKRQRRRRLRQAEREKQQEAKQRVEEEKRRAGKGEEDAEEG
ncbi:hypothetical protein V8C35DRAFT_318530 [Trichoderma chlorosporum]